jgi:protein TonB
MANYTVLLIDYEPRSIERFRDPLVGAGYTVEIATDGISGIEAFHRLNPDMVLVEAMIPKKHGFEVCQELKRTPHGRQTPVLITTGVYKGRKYRTQALHIYGCDEYIEKPIAPEQLLEIVGRFLGPGSSGPSGGSKGSSESSDSPEGHGGTQASSTPKAMPALPKAVSRTRPVAVPRAFVTDETEDEIMARLDAILPGEPFSSQSGGHAPQVVIAATQTVEEPLEAAPELDPIPEVESGSDPFAQMRAELDAELGSLSAALALELSPAADTPETSFPSDQQTSPSLLETLPSPEVGVPVAPTDPTTSATPDEKPGQVVSFDSKRSRKSKKKAGKEATPPARSQQTAAIVTTPASLPPMPASKPAAAEAAARSRAVPSPQPHGAKRRSAAAWIWAGVGILAVGATYIAISWKGSTTAEPPADLPARAQIASKSAAPIPEASSQPVAPDPEPAAIAPPPPEAPAPAPPAAEVTSPASEAKKIVAKPASVAAVNAKKTADKPAAVPAAVAAAPPKSKASHAGTSKPPSQAAPSALESEASIAGVETLPALPPAAPVATIAPGTLVAIDETDSWPASLKRTLPTYPMAARQLGLAGTVVMNVLVNEQGTVDQVVLVSGIAGGDLNESAMRAVRSWTYRPATKQGVPVKVWTSEQIAFKR